MLQHVIVALLVAGSAAYAAWALMPASWRQALGRRLGRPVPPRSACGGCDSCANAPSERPRPIAEQPIHIAPRR